MLVENQISQKHLGLWPHLSPRGVGSVKILKKKFQATVFKISENVGHVGRKSDQSKKFGLVAPFQS